MEKHLLAIVFIAHFQGIITHKEQKTAAMGSSLSYVVGGERKFKNMTLSVGFRIPAVVDTTCTKMFHSPPDKPALQITANLNFPGVH